MADVIGMDMGRKGGSIVQAFGGLQGKGNPADRKGSAKGFTLLELLIAMSLLVLIVSITMGAMSLASRSVAAGERKMEDQERFRTVAAVMDAQIQSQLSLSYGAAGSRINYFRGDAKSLQLMTGHSLWGGGEGYMLVDYRIEPDEGGGETLYDYERTPKWEGERKAKLFIAASEMNFAYFYKAPEEKEGRWSEQWQDETAVPDAVSLLIRYGKKTIAFQFPVRARGEVTPVTTAPSSATGGAKK